MGRPFSRYDFTGVFLVLLIFIYFAAIAEARSFRNADREYEVVRESAEDEPVDVLVFSDDDDPRGIVMRRWRRFIRNTVFKPGYFIRKAIAAMIIPGTLAGIISGTVASSLVGVGAGGVTGGIAGAGLGGLGGILVPTRSILTKTKHKSKSDKAKQKDKGKTNKKKKVEEEEQEEEEEDDEEAQDENDDEEDESDNLGRNAPFEPDYDDSSEMVLLLRGAINVDRLYELRNKMKLLKIKNKFKTKRRHYLWYK